MFSAISVASISGLRISTMFSATSPLVILARSPRSFSMSAPFLPITTPGRAVWMVTRARLAGRSMTILATPAWLSRSRSTLRMWMSSWSILEYSPPSAYHRESQVRLMPSRRPMGLTF